MISLQIECNYRICARKTMNLSRICSKAERFSSSSTAPDDGEMITMIVNTLSVFYYEKMVGYMPSSFPNLVFAGERIEVGNLIMLLL